MSLTSHPRWGTPIGIYPSFCGLFRSDLSVDSELAGLQAMQKISQLGSEKQLPTHQDPAKRINLSTLHAALRLALDPTTVTHLEIPGVISGCTQLMKTVVGKSPGVASPFSYEYGSHCFELLIVTLNMCLMQRWGKINEARKLGDMRPEAAAYLWASVGLSFSVIDQFSILNKGGDCDWVLGWSTSAPHRRQTSLLSRSEISALLDMLWQDRKHFSTAMTRCNPAAFGLSGLLFIFSRYISHARDFEQSTGSEVLRARLFELAHRYMLSADKYQREATQCVIQANAYDDLWIKTPKHIDVEDSRSLMSLFINLFSSKNPKSIPIRDAFMMFRLVSLATDTGSQDLLPAVLQYIIKYGWSILLSREDKENLEIWVQIFLGPLLWLINPPHNRPYRLTTTTQTNIMDVICHHDFMDWIASAMIRFDPAKSNAVTSSLADIISFYGGLAKVVPKSVLARRFRDYNLNIGWKRFHDHLLTVQGGSSRTVAPSAGQKKHYDKCNETWVEIGQLLGFESAVDISTITACSSQRCPGTYTTEGPQFGCTSCVNTVYCNDRCQAVDWKFGGHNVLHWKWCQGDIPRV
ncbi:unnamed protein product [Rhizoctonia solani]|uniref:MYND-type domain-containing protein n=1 Tax=Rhizoctonia solani TaxID=456999 RepID=A0A8H3CSG3_9AGAM|nr:unnamed protein product [Rhizoctonia solani]